ncbi:hypothetical protein [Peribacillus sp. NPDC097295]|uniref:hypothetical protein n=1 Tax=Peribacillus sp. NPDC097295 TaxID=3364402 RepID=UPI00380616EB
MSTGDIILSIVIGIGTGLISGYVSGSLVTSKFNKKDKELNWKKELSEEIQQMVRYLDLVELELSFIKKQLLNGQTVDYTYLDRMLVDEPRMPSFKEDRLTEVSTKNISSARKLIKEIKNANESNEIDEQFIKKLDSRLIRAKIDVLSIEPK